MVSLGVLVFEKDLGSSLLFFGLFLFLLYVATERAGWLIIGGLLFAGGAFFAYPDLRPRAEAGRPTGCTRSPRTAARSRPG